MGRTIFSFGKTPDVLLLLDSQLELTQHPTSDSLFLFRATETTQINLGIKQMELMDQETKYSEIYKGCTVFLLPFQSMKKYNENIFSA